MYLSQFTRRARALLDAGISIELKSPPGIGKSETVADLPAVYSRQDSEEWGFQKLFIATQTPPDLLGYMTVGDRLIEMKPVRVSEFSMPIWMMSDVSGRPLNSYKRGNSSPRRVGQGRSRHQTRYCRATLEQRSRAVAASSRHRHHCLFQPHGGS